MADLLHRDIWVLISNKWLSLQEVMSCALVSKQLATVFLGSHFLLTRPEIAFFGAKAKQLVVDHKILPVLTTRKSNLYSFSRKETLSVSIGFIGDDSPFICLSTGSDPAGELDVELPNFIVPTNMFSVVKASAIMTERKILRSSNVLFICLDISKKQTERIPYYWNILSQFRTKKIVGFIGMHENIAARDLSYQFQEAVESLPAIPHIHMLYFTEYSKNCTKSEIEIVLYLAISMATKVFNLQTFL